LNTGLLADSLPILPGDGFRDGLSRYHDLTVKPFPRFEPIAKPQDTSASSPAPAEQRATAPWQWALLGLITLLAAGLRAYELGAKTFWLDEGMSVAIARLDWYNFARILWRREGNMSLYYLLLHFWLHLGNGEAFVRSLSVVLAVATVPAIYLLGRRLYSSRAGLIAAALLAVNAFHIRWSQEARSYSLLVLLCVLSSLFFLKCLDAPTRTNRFAWVLSSVLAVYAHFFAGLLLLSQWISLRWLASPPGIIKKGFRWAALAILPLVIFAAKTGAGPLHWVKRPGPRDLWNFAVHLTGSGGPLLLFLYVAACAAALEGVQQSWRKQTVPWDAWRYRFLLLWLLFPPLLILLFSWARPLFVPRYFIFCLPPLLLLAAAGLARLGSPWAWAPAALLVVGLSFFGALSHRNEFDPERDDWRSTSQYVLSNSRPGDAVIFHIAAARMPYEFYLSLAGRPGNSPEVLYPYSGTRITFQDFGAKPDYAGLARSLPRYQRVWLVLSHAGADDAPDQIHSSLSNLLGDRYADVATYHFQGIEVRLYARPKG